MVDPFKQEEKKPYTYSSIEMRKSSSKLGWIIIVILGIIALVIFILSKFG